MAQSNIVEVSYTIIEAYELISKALCVVAKPGKQGGDIVSSSNPEDCVGAGICSEKDSTGRYSCVVDGIVYKFTPSGKPANNEASNWWCYLAKANKEAVDAGTVVGEIDGKTIVREEDGSIRFLPGEKVSVSVNNLNARDQYALQVLHGFLEHIDKPASLSPNEISYYCDKAYEWASYLITTAAAARATVYKDGGVTSAKKDIDVDDLSSNMEILLNNLVVEMEKTDITERDESREVNSKLITLRHLDTVVEVLDKLRERIDTQANSIVELVPSITDLVTVVRQLKTTLDAVGASLININTSLENINVNVTYTE